MPVRAWPYMQKEKTFQTMCQKQQPHRPVLRSRVSVRAKRKNFQTVCQKQQPHRPFLRSRMSLRAWPYVQKKKTFKPRARNNNHTGRSFALVCPYVRGRTCKKKLSNNYAGRSFALVNDDWIRALCLSINAHKKSRKY